ncbi:MAG: FMN-binding protein [Clostridia bacterium]|nr:FMN-binding protein [Clostridia bacterium]
MGRAAEKTIPERIIDQQSTRVDAVSGATRSSIAIMNAVEDALQKAK